LDLKKQKIQWKTSSIGQIMQKREFQGLMTKVDELEYSEIIEIKSRTCKTTGTCLGAEEDTEKD
jgi:hypothetical protein